MSRNMKISDATDVLNRLRSIKVQITPEERQLLGITEEDIASFTSEEQLLSPKEIQEAIYDIVQEAYQNVPAFKQIVDQDIARDPDQFNKSAKVVGTFLRHLRSILPPEKSSWISGDVFSIAHDIMKDALSRVVRKPEAPVNKKIEIPPMTDADFKLFGADRNKLNADTRWENIKNNVLFFLGKLKNTAGKTIKNDLTKKMPDETKIDYMERFLNHLRDLKIKARGKLKPFEEKDLGKDLQELKKIARAIVLPSKKKEVPTRKDDIWEVQQEAARLVNYIRSIMKIYQNPKLEASFDKMRDLIDSSLPSAALVQDRLNEIQKAVNALDLTKLQFLTLLEVNPDALSYNDPSKTLLEEYELKLKEIDKNLKTKPGDEELELKKKGIIKNIDQLKDLREKDLTSFKEAVEAYFDTLRTYKKELKDRFSGVDINKDKLFQTFIKLLDQFVLEFNRLARQQIFKARWEGRSEQLFRKEKKEELPEEETEEELSAADPVGEFAHKYIDRMAAVEGKTYADVLEKFRGKGIGDALEKIHDIFTDDESGLPFLEQKLLSIMEVGPGLDPSKKRELYNKYHKVEGLPSDQAIAKIKQEVGGNIYNLSSKNYTGNPLGGEGLKLDEMSKVVNKLRSLVKKIKFEGKRSDAEDVITWAADLPKHIKRIAMKKAEFAQHLRRIAYRLLEAEDQKKKQYKGVGTEAPYKEPGQAGWIVFRERLTKLGKKAMKSFFDRPNFAAELIEAMEHAGLNKMLVQGGKVEPQDIDPILEEVLRKATGRTGNLENILGTKAMQEYRKEFDIKKINKEVEEARGKVKDLNQKIWETEEKYLPKLDAFAEVLQDPQTAVQKFLKSLRGGTAEKEIRPEEIDKKVPTAVKIDSSNYYPTLEGLFKKYITSVKTKSAAAKSDIPTAVLSKYLAEKATFSKLKEKAERDKKPEDVKKYYRMLNDLSDKVDRLFAEDDIEAVLEADKNTLTNIESFMDTPEAKTETEGIPQLAQKMMQALKESMVKQEKAVNELKKMRTVLDKEVKGFRDLYELAVSPELRPEKEEEKKIKEEYREREKGLSYLMDRSTYKKKMNEIMTYRPGKEKIEWPTAVTEPTILPPERKKEYEDAVKKIEQDMVALNKRIDYAHKGILLSRLKDNLAIVEKVIADYKAEIGNIEKDIEATPFNEILEIDKNIENVPEEKRKSLEKDEALINEKAKSFGGTDKMKKRKEQLDRSKNEEIKKYMGYMEGIKKRISELEAEMARIKPEYAPDKPISERIKDMKFKMQQMMSHGGTTALKVPTPEQEVKDLQERMRGLQEMRILLESDEYAKSGDPSVRGFMKELDSAIQSTKTRLEELGKRAPVMVKTAADKDLSEYEYQLEFGKGLEPAPYMKEIKKPRGWEVIDKLFRETKRERSALRDKEEKGLVSNLASSYVKQRIRHLEDSLKAIDAYQKQLVGIRHDVNQEEREDFVSFENMVNKFEDLVFEYMDKLKKFKNQRDDAESRISYLKESLDHLKEMFDPDTGKFIGMDDKEIANLKSIFLRMLYRDLEGYWATQIGKNLSVFGERDTDWYNNVFSTFKHVAQARGNKKALALLNKYKQETRSDFDDIHNRLKSQQLEKEYEALLEGYQKMGVDPSISSRLKDLQTRIETLKKQEKQVDQIFKHMAVVSQEALHEKFKEYMNKRYEEAQHKAGDIAPKEKKGLKDVDFDKKIDTSMTKTEGDLTAELSDTAKAVEQADTIRKELADMANKIKTEEPEEKIAYNKLHRDYNHRILYGSVIQAKIAELMVLEVA